ncbi:MAG: putative metal-binding motif-containing protein, partial [Nanoarchaeota archaeon]|nr:putative metal-binding motif-containing protein [Nanoarchaeota archaeon]
MSAETNAHAELPGLSDYNWVVCCQGTLDTTSGNEILSLSANTNAHVASPGFYTSKIYLKDTQCEISNSGSSYNSILLSMSDLTNAHVAKPDYYSYKLYCNIGEGGVSQTPCTDTDGDGYGAEGTDLSSCSASITLEDCDDTNSNIHPGAPEIQDGIDNNCNGLIDESCTYLCATYNYKELACRSDTTCNCYYSTTTNACRNCAQSPSPFCITFDNVN